MAIQGLMVRVILCALVACCKANPYVDYHSLALQALGKQPNNEIEIDNGLGPNVADETHHNIWMESGKFQGDIIGDDVDQAPLNDQSVFEAPFDNAVRNPRSRWPNGIVPFLIDLSYSSWERQVLTKAMNSLNTRTKRCISFVSRTFQRDYLYIRKGSGCYSHVGRVGGRQELVLGRGCLHHEVAVHEMLHALGFWHEQSRSDRDQHIRIYWQNIRRGTQSNFAKLNPRIQTLLGEPYDFHSVMHYHPTAYSVNGRRTIEAIQPQFTKYLGTAKDASQLDILKLSKLYGCPSVSPTGNTAIPTPQPLFSSTTRSYTTSRWTRQTTTQAPAPGCLDKFEACEHAKEYCFKPYLSFIMQSTCRRSCNYC